MNYVFIAVIAILVIGAVYGLKKGFFDMLFGALTMMIALVLAVTIGPKLAQLVQNDEAIMEKLSSRIAVSMNLDELAIQTPDVTQYIEKLNLPDVIKEKMSSAEINEKLQLDQVADEASKQIAKTVGMFLARMVVSTLGLVVVFLVALILLTLIKNILNLVAKLPLLKQANKLAGMALGLLQSILVIWILFALITITSGSELGQYLFTQIKDNQILSFLYDNNIPMNYIIKSAGKVW